MSSLSGFLAWPFLTLALRPDTRWAGFVLDNVYLTMRFTYLEAETITIFIPRRSHLISTILSLKDRSSDHISRN